jgi:hypothetical protein
MRPRRHQPSLTRTERGSRQAVFCHRLCIAGIVMLCLSGCAPPDNAPDNPVVEIRLNQLTAEARFEIHGLSSDQLQSLSNSKLTAPQWSEAFAVYVGESSQSDNSTESNAAQPAILGDYTVEENAIVFQPRFPLRPGLKYRAVFNPARLPASAKLVAAAAERSFSRPPPPAAPPTNVAHVYPSRGTLPENQLKFYIHFSASMSRGDSYQHIQLFEESGKEVEFPFLELGEELWDDTGTRFTLFFDPGRIKRGLKPREEVGPSLEEGKSYTLRIRRAWLDATGNPLTKDFEKKFSVAAPDDIQPDLQKWRLTAPPAATRQPLEVQFDEPLDHAMLGRVLAVKNSQSEQLAGQITIDTGETRWHFIPAQPWSAGQYTLVIDTALEDLAGNSLLRPFEVDVFRPIKKTIETETVTLTFEVHRIPNP